MVRTWAGEGIVKHQSMIAEVRAGDVCYRVNSSKFTVLVRVNNDHVVCCYLSQSQPTVLQTSVRASLVYYDWQPYTDNVLYDDWQVLPNYVSPGEAFKALSKGSNIRWLDWPSTTFLDIPGIAGKPRQIVLLPNGERKIDTWEPTIAQLTESNWEIMRCLE